MVSWACCGRHAPSDHGTPSRPQRRVPSERVERDMDGEGPSYHFKFLNLKFSGIMGKDASLKVVDRRDPVKTDDRDARWLMGASLHPARHAVPKVSCPPMLSISLHWRMLLASETSFGWHPPFPSVRSWRCLPCKAFGHILRGLNYVGSCPNQSRQGGRNFIWLLIIPFLPVLFSYILLGLVLFHLWQKRINTRANGVSQVWLHYYKIRSL